MIVMISIPKKEYTQLMEQAIFLKNLLEVTLVVENKVKVKVNVKVVDCKAYVDVVESYSLKLCIYSNILQ